MRHPSRPSRAVATLASGLALLSPLAGCSGEEASSSSATSPDAPVLQPGAPGEPATSLTGSEAAPSPSRETDPDDVSFLQDMIVHHAQAVVMGEIVHGRLRDPAVAALADRIADEQEPEMGGMARMLRAWEKDVPPQADNPRFGLGSGGHDHHDMAGMATQEDLEALRSSSGAALDTLYLRLMIAHHEGAITMCDAQRAEGSDERTGELADEITVTQQVQVERMREMQQRLAA